VSNALIFKPLKSLGILMNDHI